MTKKTKFIALCAALAMALALIAAIPGTSQDPLVSRSLMDKEIELLVAYINEQFSQIQELIAQQETFKSAAPTTVIVEARRGEVLIGETGTKMVVRGGSANVFSRVENGLSDLTAGAEIFHGEPAPLNHNLLISRDDWRGITVTSDVAWVIIEGNYFKMTN